MPPFPHSPSLRHWRRLQIKLACLSDTRAQLFANYYDFVKAVTVNRPRTLCVRLSYKFGER